MNINKDEAAILSVALQNSYSEFCHKHCYTKEDSLNMANTLLSLADKLDKFSFDGRRCGRTSNNDLPDILKRVVKAYKQKTPE